MAEAAHPRPAREDCRFRVAGRPQLVIDVYGARFIDELERSREDRSTSRRSDDLQSVEDLADGVKVPPGAAPGHRLAAQRPAPRQLLAAERWPHRDSGLRPDDGNHQGAAERHGQIRVPPFVEPVRQDAGGPHGTWIPGQGAEREREESQDRRAHHRGGAQPSQQGRRHGGFRSDGPHESRRRR
eukprot:scaffold568_cov233-Pinguiococcus_pyrenoidosus.AAC.4